MTSTALAILGGELVQLATGALNRVNEGCGCVQGTSNEEFSEWYTFAEWRPVTTPEALLFGFWRKSVAKPIGKRQLHGSQVISRHLKLHWQGLGS